MGTTETGEVVPVEDPEADTQPLVPLCEAPDWPALVVTWAAFFVAGLLFGWYVVPLMFGG